jgi:hypothetical protein
MQAYVQGARSVNANQGNPHRNAQQPDHPDDELAPQGPLAPCNEGAGLLPALTVSLRQSVTQLVVMRPGPRALALSHEQPPQKQQDAVAWASAGGAMGCLQPASRRVTEALTRLRCSVVGVESRQRAPVGAARQGHMDLPPRASAHRHVDAWCAYDMGNPYAESALWKGNQSSGLLCWAGPPMEFEEQSMPIDAAWWEAVLGLLDAAGAWGTSCGSAQLAGHRPRACMRINEIASQLNTEDRQALWALRGLGLAHASRALACEGVLQ